MSTRAGRELAREMKAIFVETSTRRCGSESKDDDSGGVARAFGMLAYHLVEGDYGERKMANAERLDLGRKSGLGGRCCDVS